MSFWRSAGATAEERLRKWVDLSVKLCQDYVRGPSGVKITAMAGMKRRPRFYAAVGAFLLMSWIIYKTLFAGAKVRSQCDDSCAWCVSGRLADLNIHPVVQCDMGKNLNPIFLLRLHFALHDGDQWWLWKRQCLFEGVLVWAPHR